MSFPEPEGFVWLDGRLVPADEARFGLADPGIQWGLGVFETIAAREGRLLDLEPHLLRLGSGAKCFGVPLPGMREIEEACRTIASRIEGSFGWLKVLATRPGRCAVYGGRMDSRDEGSEATAILLPWTRSVTDPLVGIKTQSYAPAILGLEEARRRGADDGIWRNSRGHLAEATTSNLFVVWRERIFTPAPRDGILPGITRAIAIRAAADLGLVVHEGKVRLKRLEEAHEAFLTSSLRGVRPLVRFESSPVGKGSRGPITERLAAEVARIRLSPAPPDLLESSATRTSEDS